jgi:hypothetical protein
VIYFLEAVGVGHIKIGYTFDKADRRVKELQTASPVPLRLLACMTGTADDEEALHERFAADRLCGEWFKPNDELLALIEVAKVTPVVREERPPYQRSEPTEPTKPPEPPEPPPRKPQRPLGLAAYLQSEWNPSQKVAGMIARLVDALHDEPPLPLPITIAAIDWQPNAAVVESLAKLLRGLPASFDDADPPIVPLPPTPKRRRRQAGS